MIIVLTGGIGSGKSQVCRILAEKYGFHIYEADSKVKDLYHDHPTLLDDIESSLGKSFRGNDGVFQPSLLSKVIFSDKAALETVESIVFPVLKEDFADWMADIHDGLPIVFESATVLEKPYFDSFGDITVLVNAPYSLRLERAVRRDADKNRVESRMAHQILMNRLSDGYHDDRIDYVIDNSGPIEELESKINDFVSKIDYNINVTYRQQRC